MASSPNNRVFTFSWNTDLGVIQSLLTQPRCYRRMANDSAPEPNLFEVTPNPRLGYVTAQERGRDVAVFLLASHAPGVEEVHFCMLPDVWGVSAEVGKQFLAWIWRNTGIWKMIGPVPSYNRLALRTALACGFQVEGQQTDHRKKHGRSFHQILTSITRPQ